MRRLIRIAACAYLLATSWVAPWEAKPALAEPAPDDHWWDGFGSSSERGLDYSVHALAVFRGELIAAGEFGASGTVLLDKIGRWDGEAWHSLGGGIDHVECPRFACYPRVNVLAVYEDDLYAGGGFWTADDGRVRANYIARWDGSTWHAVGGGLDGEVFALAVHNGKLVAGGLFTLAEDKPANRIAVWDGRSWSPLGGGVRGPGGGFITSVHDFAVYGGQLVVAGSFGQAGDVAANNIAQWDGTAWHPLGDGSSEISWAATYYNGQLYAQGTFRAADGSRIDGLGRWDGSAWNPTGTFNAAFAFAEYNGDLLAASSDLMRWDGSEWSFLGLEDVSTFAVLGSSLFVGGTFTMAGGKPSARIARWDDVITAVEIQDFRATTNSESITLTWRVPFWAEIRGIAIERSESREGPYRTQALIVPEAVMSYADSDVRPGVEYWYRIVAQALDRSLVSSHEIAVTLPRGLGTALLAPIPAAGRQLAIRYRIGEPGTPVVLGAYDIRGQRVRSLEVGVREPGDYVRPWDGRTETGAVIPRGVYVIRLQAGPLVATRKVVVVGN